MTLQELRDKRTKLLLDAHTIMSGTDVTVEQRTSVDKMLADANTFKLDIERVMSLDALDAENRSTMTIPRGVPGADAAVDARSNDERRIATGKALRSFLTKEKFETRDLTVLANGGVMIPVGVADPKIALKFAGSVYDLVYKFRTQTGEAVKAPMINDTTQGFVLNSTAITVTDPTTSGVTISIDDARSNPILLDNSLIQDSGFDLVSFVEKAIQSRYTRTVSNWITNGNTSNVGALSAITAGVTANTTLVTKFVDLVAMVTTLDPAYAGGACWSMNNTTLGQVMNIQDGNLRPIFLAYNDGGTSGFAGSILGYPVKLNPYQPANGIGLKYIQFGDFAQGYTFREVLPGVMVKRSDDRWIELNKVGFVAFARVGGAVTDAGTSPIISLTGK